MQMPLGRSGGRGKNLLGQEVADFAVRSQSGRRSTWKMQTERSEKRGESRRGIGGNQKGQHSLTRQRGSELLNDPWASFIHATQYAGKSLGRGDLIRSSKTNRKFVVEVGMKGPLIPSQLQMSGLVARVLCTISMHKAPAQPRVSRLYSHTAHRACIAWCEGQPPSGDTLPVSGY